MDPNGTIKLLGVILRELPNLPGAACQGHHQLYEDVAFEDPVLANAAVGGGREVVLQLPATARVLSVAVRPECEPLARSSSLLSAGPLGRVGSSAG